MPWNEVKHDSPEDVRQTCVDLLVGAIPRPGYSMSLEQFTALLTPYEMGGFNGYKENPANGDNPVRPTYFVYTWTNPNTGVIEIALAFYKTIFRTGGPTVTEFDSKPTRRWWTINLGCTQSAGGPSIYAQVKQKCRDFYASNEMQPIDGNTQHLYIFDDATRQPEPNRYKADEVLQELLDDRSRDAKLHVTDRGNEPAYAAFAEIPNLENLSRLEIAYDLS